MDSKNPTEVIFKLIFVSSAKDDPTLCLVYESISDMRIRESNGARYDLYLPIFECQECGYSLPADAKMLYDGGYFCSSARKRRWQHGSGLTTGEETEQIFSYMSRYNSTTKNMLKAEREEELGESSFFWNQRKHDSLARVLASRFCKAKEAAELIRKELADLSLDEKQLLIWIAELTNLAQSLNKRSVSQNDVQKGIELVCDSIRTKKSHISSVAVSSKMRSRYRAKIEADKKKLRELIAVYNEDNTEKLSVGIAEEGNFPWCNGTPQPTDNDNNINKIP
ncbi:uncharacterized protein [Procambarus clarkii]|uniref:uncharacterized protein n=1 Tax=Procambarus clarkii TaxID=6728 RepID=UPI003742DBAD